MNRIVRYFDGGLPVNRCNFRCNYCYVSLDPNLDFNKEDDETLHYSFDTMKKALALERVGGACMFNFVAAGETLLFKQIVELVDMVTEIGHFARILTNGTVREPLNRLIQLPDAQKERLVIKFSMHWLELKKTNTLDKFFENIKMVQNAGVSFTVELCASDEFVPDIEDIKELCLKNIGALPHVVELRNQEYSDFRRLTEMPIDTYQKIWRSFDSPLFNFETQDYEQYQSQFCYAGEYGFSFSWQTGETRPCSCNGNRKLFNLFENPEVPLNFVAIGSNCPAAHCYTNYLWCPLVGNWEVDYAPTYAQERDRVMLDGRHWLTPTLQEVYSHRCSEFHKPYGDNKKTYVDLLMKKIYNTKHLSESDYNVFKNIVFNKLSELGVQKIGVYGVGYLGKWYLQILEEIGIPVLFGIDINKKNICSSVPLFSLEEVLPDADCIIVSVYYEMSNIYPMLFQKTNAKIISITHLMNE